jgi:hypothetical protein
MHHTASQQNTNEWLIDSGASKQVTHHKESFDDFCEFEKMQSVALGDGRSVMAYGIGTVTLTMTFKNGEPRKVKLMDVLYVPKLAKNLFSVSAATRKGNKVEFGNFSCWIRSQHGKLCGVGKRRNDGLYQLCCAPVKSYMERASVATSSNQEDQDWQTSRTLAQCNKFMLEQQLQCDVTFRVGTEGATEDIHAHK